MVRFSGLLFKFLNPLLYKERIACDFPLLNGAVAAAAW